MQDIKIIITVVFILFLIAVSLTACSDGELDIKTVSEAASSETASSEAVSSDNVEQTEATPTESEQKVFSVVKEETNSSVRVYICGAVINEGVYELKASSRIQDVLEMAGGYSESAAHGVVNLAEFIVDGEKIYIPTLEEVEDGTYDKMMNSSDNMSGGYIGSPGAYGIDSSYRISSNIVSSNGAVSNGLVNINSACKEDLMTLPGIGESKALDIITYRDSHGGFSEIKDIKKVSGIGDATFEKIKSKITVE
jgi:competence protein ComEA